MGVARAEALRGGGQRSPRPPPLVWLPATLVAGAMALPLAYLVGRTLGSGVEVWELLFRARTLHILARSLLLMGAVSGACIALALPLAWLTTRTDLPWRRGWAVVTALPLVIPSYVGGFLVVAVLGPKGMLQQALAGPLGIDRFPDIYGFPGAMLTLTLLSYPYVLLSLRAGIKGLDPALEESARSLGYSPYQVFWRVTLPQLRPALAAGTLLVALYTLSDFGAVSLLRYETFTWAIYLQYEAVFDRTLAAALSLVLVALALLLVIAEARTRSGGRYYRSSAGAVRPSLPMALRSWRWPALAFCGLVALLALGLPVAVLSYWLGRGVLAGEPLRLLWGPAWNSVSVSALAAILTTAAALPVALFTVRFPGRASALVERLSYLGFALPGIVIALSLVFFGAHYLQPLYQTLFLLLFAYGVLFLPTALGPLRASLLQVSPRQEEAARSLGRSPLGVLTAITLPLVRSGVVAGGALAFLLTMKELPATLILSPIGFKTLATSVWSAANAAFFAQAAAPALLLVLASALPTALFILREGGRR